VIRSTFDTESLDWVRRHARAVIDMRYVVDQESATSWVRSERGRRAARHSLPALARYWPPSIGARITDAVGCDFDVIVVMGTYVAGAVLPFLDAGIAGILDAFDDDTHVNASLGKLDPSFAREVPLYQEFQREVFSWFDHVLFASLEDAVAPFGHLPNAVHIPPARALPPGARRLELLFVGNPTYLPNRDALDRLRHGIVPAIERMGTPVRLLHPRPDQDVAPFYERAHIAAVPLRAGGGTRIKVLEAFAHGCPVVSTPTGARGLGISAGRELELTADDDDDIEFAQVVRKLASDDAGRMRIAEAARSFVVAHHDAREIGDRLAVLVGTWARRGKRD
jgi:hypothetical protein